MTPTYLITVGAFIVALACLRHQPEPTAAVGMVGVIFLLVHAS